MLQICRNAPCISHVLRSGPRSLLVAARRLHATGARLEKVEPHPKDQRHPRFGHLPLATSGPIDCALHGSSLLHSPYLNKGSAFSDEERRDFDLTGLLPSNVQTLSKQVERAYEQFKSRPSELYKNTFMASMKTQNTVLYYALLLKHLKEMMPVIYTPTEGEAIQDYSRIFRQPEGCHLDITQSEEEIDRALRRWGDPQDIDLIVVSDAEQILGIGDQGVGGILISTAKLAIYTACAGIHPHRTLPVILDCGTDNKDLLADELYLGNRRPRVRGEQYDAFVDTFMRKARNHYPHAYIHCEDFGVTNARRILERYRDDLPIFNDDVQGTGCVTTAAVMAALKVSGVALRDMRVLMFGAGSAGTGIADQLVRAVALEAGTAPAEARAQIWLMDKQGLLTRASEGLSEAQKLYAAPEAAAGLASLENVVNEHKPHVLIGTSTVAGAFTEPAVRAMASHVPRPVILPLSNPTRLHEAKPADLLAWTDGAALVATGSPFAPVERGGRVVEIAECNNSAIYPGIGLGAVLCRARKVTDKMLVAATQALASRAPILAEGGDESKGLLPEIESGEAVRDISVDVAMAVVRAAIEEGVAEVQEIPRDDKVLEEWVREQMWEAVYRPLRRVDGTQAGKMGRGEAGMHSR